ncbi:MAG TPA: hypothetical protein VGP90_08100 [Acidimicrobiia bacterium]|jgi:hypothetical protein|nr:hypothetical protein [Acidimicrobiia bacterium]
MAAAAQVGVVGLRALRRDVEALAGRDSTVYRELAQAGRRAVEPIAEAARAAVPHVSGDLAADIRITGSASGAAVRMGRARIAYAGAVDFGGWPPGREFLPNGRYLYPAARGLAPRAAQLYADALQRALDNYAWTNTTPNGEAIHD